MKIFSLIPALLLFALLSTGAYADANAYECSFDRTDYDNEQHIDTYTVKQIEGFSVLRTYDHLGIHTVCQVATFEGQSFQKLSCAIIHHVSDWEASGSVKAGADYLNVGLTTAIPSAAFELTCSFP